MRSHRLLPGRVHHLLQAAVADEAPLRLRQSLKLIEIEDG